MSKRRSTRGSIIKISDDVFRVAFRAGTDPATGKPVRVSETVHGSRRDAQQRLTELLHEHDRTGIVPDRDGTVATFTHKWLAHVAHRIKPTTLKRYRELLLVHVVPSIGPVRMTELRAPAVQSTIDKVLQVRSPRTAVNVFRVTSTMLGEAVQWGVVSTNVAKALRPPRAPRATLNIPDAATCEAILAKVRGRDAEGPVTIALGTGMRLGEILALRWRDVDLDRRVLRVTATLSHVGGQYAFTPPKTSRARRSVDLPAFVVTYLRRQHKDQLQHHMALRDVWIDTDVVLDNGLGEPLAPWTASADFRRITKELELPRTRFHDLRHAHATRLFEAGVGPKAVSERLGHSSTSFTMDVYSAVIPSLGRAAADAIEDVLGEGGR